MITMIKYNQNRSFKRTLSQFSHKNVFYFYAFVKQFVARAKCEWILRPEKAARVVLTHASTRRTAPARKQATGDRLSTGRSENSQPSWRRVGQETSTRTSRSRTARAELPSWCFQSSHGNRRTTQRRRARRWLAARCSFALTSVKAVGQSLRVLLLDVPLSSSAEELEGQTAGKAKKRQA